MNSGRRLRSARAGPVDNRRLRHDRRHSSDQDALDLVERNGIGLYDHAVRALAASGGKDGADPWISKGVVDIRQAVLVATSQVVPPRVERMRLISTLRPQPARISMPRLIPSWLGVLAGDTNPITRSQPRWLQHRRWVDNELLHSCDGTGIEAAVGGRDGQVLSNDRTLTIGSDSGAVTHASSQMRTAGSLSIEGGLRAGVVSDRGLSAVGVGRKASLLSGGNGRAEQRVKVAVPLTRLHWSNTPDAASWSNESRTTTVTACRGALAEGARCDLSPTPAFTQTRTGEHRVMSSEVKAKTV